MINCVCTELNWSGIKMKHCHPNFFKLPCKQPKFDHDVNKFYLIFINAICAAIQ